MQHNLSEVKSDVKLMKDNFSELFAKLDEFISLYKKQEQELLMLISQMKRLEERVAKLESRGLRVAGKITIDGLKIFFEEGNWLLLRPSGTEPLVRVYAETPNQKQTRHIIEIASQWIKEKLGT